MEIEKSKGLYQKYVVKKINNPDKEIDCVVLEFDDPIARDGIWAWCGAMKRNGFVKCAEDTMKKLDSYRDTTSL